MAARKISVVPQEVSAALTLQRNQNQAPEEVQAEPEEMQVEGSDVSFFIGFLPVFDGMIFVKIHVSLTREVNM